ncbi:MAG TPA: hypothetical protein VGI50_09590 [Solirubrobacteraceae bacterium]
MAVRAAHAEAELIDIVCSRVRERLPGEQCSPCESFVRQYYHRVPVEDLVTRDPLDLFGAAVGHWNLAQQRAPGQAKVHVHNPDFEVHGWRCAHTVIEIVSDDMPFLVDSVTMELSRQGYSIDLMIHPVIRVRRDQHGALTEVLEPVDAGEGAIAEWIMHAEVVRETDRDRVRELGEGIGRVLDDVRRVVDDSAAMRGRAVALIDELDGHPPPVDTIEREAVKAFLAWLADDHFTFFGSREYDLVLEDGEAGLRAVPGSGLGMLRGTPAQAYTTLRPKALEIARGRHPLVLTKANSRATVHRPAYLDYIGVKRFAPDGVVKGESRFLGLYTAAAYKESIWEIPGLSGKVRVVLSRAAFPPGSHEETALTEILESYPRDSLFQVKADELFALVMGVLGLGERQRVRLFVCRDRLDRFVDCLVTIPRDRYHTDNRERVLNILLEAFSGVLLDWRAQLTESVLVRVYFRVRCPDGIPADFEVAEIEARLVKATRAWSDDLRDALLEEYGPIWASISVSRRASRCARWGTGSWWAYGRIGSGTSPTSGTSCSTAPTLAATCTSPSRSSGSRVSARSSVPASPWPTTRSQARVSRPVGAPPTAPPSLTPPPTTPRARSHGPASRSRTSSARSASRDPSSSLRPRSNTSIPNGPGTNHRIPRGADTRRPDPDQPASKSGFNELVQTQAAPRSRRSPSRSSIVSSNE